MSTRLPAARFLLLFPITHPLGERAGSSQRATGNRLYRRGNRALDSLDDGLWGRSKGQE
jgi:hypothetical protein